MKIIASAMSHIGNIREKNEDNLLMLDRLMPEQHDGTNGVWMGAQELLDQPQLYGVFDGMGGYEKGEHASYLTAMIAREHGQVMTDQSEEITTHLNAICYEANKKVCDEMDENKDKMGTTASMLCFHGAHVHICNIGDTPIYRIRGGEMTPIYEEHTQKSLYEKLLGKEAVKKKKYPLTQCIGIHEREMRIRPYVKEDLLQEDDVYLICSDGLTDMVPEDRIKEIILMDQPMEQKLSNLLEEALDEGGRDNITILMLKAEQDKIEDKIVEEAAPVEEPAKAEEAIQEEEKVEEGEIHE